MHRAVGVDRRVAQDCVHTDVCVIGAGPAGICLASRLAQLGHDVCLVERTPFPRSRLGESLSPGVLALLDAIGASEAVTRAGFARVREVLVHWEEERPYLREDPDARGMVVDRGLFDRLLLDHSRSLGVRVLNPAVIRGRRCDEAGHTISVDSGGARLDIRATFLADASGRAGALRAQRRRTGRRTLALYGYWIGADLPRQPRIEAAAEAWFWGVPLPDGSYNTQVFVDWDRARDRCTTSVERDFHALIHGSTLLAGCGDARLRSRVRAIDATPYLDEESVTRSTIKVGDAGLALDPLSSTGVQKAIQTALAGAIVINTLLRRPGLADAAMHFYGNSLADASARHSAWAADHYRSAAGRFGSRFWSDRAAGAGPSPPQGPTGNRARSRAPDAPLAPSPQIKVVDLPCLEGDFVTIKPSVQHPKLDGPLTFLGGYDLAALLRLLRPGMTPRAIAFAWSGCVPLSSAMAITDWLFDRGLLVPHGG
ncbi:NAD(P)/FAD-dependent oxidoreductase [Sorangium cellulosum]|uniref:flavin-dependent monooxygenase QhpG n=1 Tax=Sorangium cellulosum TaxID=56 RepID=UPI003D9A7A20